MLFSGGKYFQQINHAPFQRLQLISTFYSRPIPLHAFKRKSLKFQPDLGCGTGKVIWTKASSNIQKYFHYLHYSDKDLQVSLLCYNYTLFRDYSTDSSTKVSRYKFNRYVRLSMEKNYWMVSLQALKRTCWNINTDFDYFVIFNSILSSNCHTNYFLYLLFLLKRSNSTKLSSHSCWIQHLPN